jgi:integrase/recombinase XerD
MDVVVVVAEFKNHLKVLGYGKRTIESYSWGLGEFEAYLAGRGLTDLRKVTHQVVVAYQEKLMADPISTESRAVKIRPVKRLFEHLTETHRLLINPADGIVETCRKNRRIGTVITVDEVKRLLLQPNLSLRLGIRDRAIMEMLYSTGIRVDELIGLEVYHADVKDGILYVRKGKGKKQRVVPLGKPAAHYLKEYLGRIRPHYAKKTHRERRLFLNHSGHPITSDAIRQVLRKYRVRAGIKKSVSPHVLRRTCATHMLQQGADIRYVQKLLGHRHIRTTQYYTKVMPIDVKKTHAKTHPGVRRIGSGKENRDDED